MTAGEYLHDPFALAFPEHLPFWRAAAQGQLILPRCATCGLAHWHPRVHCPFCRSAAVCWAAAAGRARLHTYSVIPRGDGLVLLAYVRVEEGVLMLTNIVDAVPERLRIDMPLNVTFQAAGPGRLIPVFRPA